MVSQSVNIYIYSVSIQIPSLYCKKLLVKHMMNILIKPKYLIILITGIYSSVSFADGDSSKIFMDWNNSNKPGVSYVKFQQYNDICGSCHFPYQPGLLPAVSWQEIMLNTDNHFGKNLNLSPVEQRTMTRYLLDNSAGHVNDEISFNILQSLKYDPLIIRITETPYFIDTHISLGNIKGIGQCDNCHKNASQGVY